MPRRMLSPRDLFADAPGLHPHIRLEKIDQRRFAHARGSGNCRRLPPKKFFYLFDILLPARAGEDHRISARTVNSF